MTVFPIFLSSCHLLCLAHDLGLCWCPHLHGKTFVTNPRCQLWHMEWAALAKAREHLFSKKHADLKTWEKRRWSGPMQNPYWPTQKTEMSGIFFQWLMFLFFSGKHRFIRMKHNWEMASFMNFLTEKSVGRKLPEHPILLFSGRYFFFLSSLSILYENWK